jgi:hypothetical protein
MGGEGACSPLPHDPARRSAPGGSRRRGLLRAPCVRRGSQSSPLLGTDSTSPRPLRPVPPMRTFDAISNTSLSQESLLVVRPFTHFRNLLRFWRSSRSDSTVSLSDVKRLLPNARTHPFAARLPDLRHRPLVTSASRSLARSRWSAPPSIRSLSIGPKFRSTLPPHTRSPSCIRASRRSL